jgi:uncharacterized protein YlxP (DUF503 family)
MIIGLLSIEIFIPSSTSLKDKRMVLNHIRDKVRKKYNVSIAEVDFLDKWQRSLIGIALVTSQKSFAEEMLTKIFQQLDDDYNFEISQYRIEYR